MKDKKSPCVIISDDEVKSVSRAVDPRLSPEYNPSTPPSKAPEKSRLPYQDDAFSPGLYRSSGSAVTIGDSSIHNPSVACGIILTGMLPRDRLFYDHMNDIDQALDRASQLHFAGLSLVRKASELHYNAVVKQQKAHVAASYHLERENESLRRQVEILHAKKREDDNARELMRRQRDRIHFKAKGFGGYATVSPDAEEAADAKGFEDYSAAPRDAEKAIDGAGDDLYDPEEE
ncbi:hypothetical protein MKX03_033226 [Papaver bracteatum]|nr:hypothetical protein MKX03_033226 [Papaver bracteatum]